MQFPIKDYVHARVQSSEIVDLLIVNLIIVAGIKLFRQLPNLKLPNYQIVYASFR
jgi:hypothetical protein